MCVSRALFHREIASESILTAIKTWCYSCVSSPGKQWMISGIYIAELAQLRQCKICCNMSSITNHPSQTISITLFTIGAAPYYLSHSQQQ